ncbi:SMI1/KNR4 family protein [Microcoleus sp. MON2_D5]|uniref:SMI1/KNR4 family protein n=1 Tax=Microcoleus sp. MON2_D5 TaxID=2818833 RepID=UPI002FD2A6C2
METSSFNEEQTLRDEQKVSPLEKVITACPNCAQKLRAPVKRGTLNLTCPTCKHLWLWFPTGIVREQIERIKAKIELAKTIPRQLSGSYTEEERVLNHYRFFGVDRHQFQFNRPLSSDKIDVWEAKYKVSLPLEYRSFLEQIGNGGAGPYYGILPLEKWDHGISFSEKDTLLKCPSQPCLLLEQYKNEESWGVEVVGEDWEEKYDQETWAPECGTITVCEFGCGGFFNLVLNGLLRGKICYIEGLNSPVFDPSPNFLAWYEGWLNFVLTGQSS